MTKSEFKNVFETLCDYYNNQEYKENMLLIQVYFDSMKYYDYEEWKNIQEEIFKNYRTMPKISDIDKIAKQVKKQLKEQKQKEIGVCPRCYNLGFIPVTIEEHSYALACNCVFGDKVAKYTKRYDEVFPSPV